MSKLHAARPVAIDLNSIALKAKDGDREAFRALIEATQPRLYRMMLYLTHSVSLAQDLCQDTYVRMMEKMATYQPTANFPAWLLTIGKNIFLDYVKSPKHKPHRPVEDISERLNAEFLRWDREATLKVMQGLQPLGPEDRFLLILIHLEGYSYAEAAIILGVSEPAVRGRLSRAKAAFLEALKG